MLKTHVGHELWLVHQPDHARLSGYLAAHWGDNQAFARPGYFASAPSPDLLRQHVVHAIAEHDNGWWEWEASPEIDLTDNWPLNLPDVAREHPGAGLERWRVGVPRLSERHPYAALLISLHAYWLYAFSFDDLPELDEALRHPIFGSARAANRFVTHPELTRAFLDEQKQTQSALLAQLQGDRILAAGGEPQHLMPHVRLLQIMDALSLLISFGGQSERKLSDVPRRSWDDRVTMTWKPAADRRIVCDPYPFDKDPLEVFLPVRSIPDSSSCEGPPLVRLHATPLKTIRFELLSAPGPR